MATAEEIHPALAAAFWKRWAKGRFVGECFVLLGRRTKEPDGYVKIGTRERGTRRQLHGLGHRLSYLLQVGPIPDGHGVLHECDNTACALPGHLFTGTQAVNQDDMARKGRSTKGRAVGHAQRNAEKVVCIRGHQDWVTRADGSRYCRTCRNDRRRELWGFRRGA